MRIHLALVTLVFVLPPCLSAQVPALPDDPYLWLEDVTGARAMEWVNSENAKTVGVLEADPRYAGLYNDALKIAEDKDRIPTPRFLSGEIYNFWQDADHVRGVFRKTSLTGYRGATPAWSSVLDLDALAKSENANWFLGDIECEEPAERRCMAHLSDGGEDAVTLREFDLTSASFVKNGFILPHGKQDLAWEHEDTLLVSREWSTGELTASGYPFVVKRLKRGQPLSDAVEIFRGSARDGGYGVSPAAFVDGSGHRLTLIERPLSTFEAEYHLVTPGGVAKLALPLKSRLQELIAGRLIVRLDTDWTPETREFHQGSLVSLDVAQLRADPAHLKPTLIYAPGPRESFAQAAATKDRLIVTSFDNVRGRAFIYTPTAATGWTRSKIDLPDNSTIKIADADSHSDRAFLNVTGFLTPPTLWLLNAKSGALEMVKSLPPKFDASQEVVEQFEATSKDGTQVPYFVVHRRDMKLDGGNPTIVYAYGGFQVSMTPSYSANIGKLWLEHGGVYVLANIRGGGEFGPAWHEAGLKTNRQRIYDDFAAVAQDLITRRITSPRRLGIQGGSNGGLLMGVELTQHPDLWTAVDIAVPLLDMLRFEKIAAGPSWVGEYGSVSIPAEREFLASISPYNNLKAGVRYPEPLIWTTTKDDRVGPQHARKFAARLASMGVPYLFYEVTEGGHGSGTNLKEKARTTALEMVYFIRKLST
jgi:prolyl oligopeptidase